MELMQFFRILLRYWWLVAIPVVITAALSLPSLLNRSPAASGGFSTMMQYSAAQQLEAIPNRDGDYQDVWLASELTVNALTDWVKTGTFREAVIAESDAHGVEVDSASLSIASDNERSVGQIFLSYPDSEALATISQAAITVLETRNVDAFPQLGGEPAQVTLIDPPVISPAPPPLTNRFAPFIRIGLGLLAGIGLAFLAYYFDPVLRRREDVESEGLRVITTIPKR